MNVKLPSDLHRLAPFIAVAVLALAGLVLVTRGISGGGAGETGANANEVLDKAFTEGPRTGVLDLKAVITAEVAGARQATLGGTYSASGPFAQRTNPAQQDKADLKVSETDGAGKDVNLRMVSTGDRGYVRVAGNWYRLTPQQFKQAFEEETAAGAQSQTVLSDLGFDLQRWIRNPRIVGAAKVDGVDTHQVSGDLDASAMAADLDEQQAGASGGNENFDAFLRDAQKGGKVNVYVGKADGILRKADVTASYTGQLTEQATMRLTFRFDVGVREINRPQKFVAPKSALPGSSLAALDPDLLGSQADDLRVESTKGGSKRKSDPSGGKGATKPAPSGSGAAKRSRQAYINCVQQASDAAALEKCQAFVPRR
jgi:hypothetical protein